MNLREIQEDEEDTMGYGLNEGSSAQIRRHPFPSREKDCQENRLIPSLRRDRESHFTDLARKPRRRVVISSSARMFASETPMTST